jgi:hypothetical protein
MCRSRIHGETQRKSCDARRPGTGLDSQALATLGAACIDDSAATACFHANQKTVGTGAAGLGGLVCAFHFKFS